MNGPSDQSESPAPDCTEHFDTQGKAEEAIVLPIANAPATGYEWGLSLPEGVERIDDGPGRPLDPSVKLGGAAGGHLRVTAPIGDHVIVGRLARPWQPDQPVRVVMIRVHVE